MRVTHSLSKIGNYEGCPARYEFKFIKKLPEPPRAVMVRGTDTHAKLEQSLLEKNLLAIGGLSSFVKFHAERMIRAGFVPEYKLAVTREWKKCAWDAEDMWLRSVLDAFLYDPKEISIGEWKTGGVWDDHADQRELYCMMSLSCYPDTTLAKIDTIYADKGMLIGFQLLREQLAERQAHWTKRFEALERDTFFSPRPGRQCGWCAYSSRKGGPCQF